MRPANRCQRQGQPPRVAPCLSRSSSSPGHSLRLEKHKAEQLDDDVRALNRQEWLQCLLRIAIMRFVRFLVYSLRFLPSDSFGFLRIIATIRWVVLPCGVRTPNPSA